MRLLPRPRYTIPRLIRLFLPIQNSDCYVIVSRIYVISCFFSDYNIGIRMYCRWLSPYALRACALLQERVPSRHCLGDCLPHNVGNFSKIPHMHSLNYFLYLLVCSRSTRAVHVNDRVTREFHTVTVRFSGFILHKLFSIHISTYGAPYLWTTVGPTGMVLHSSYFDFESIYLYSWAPS